MVIEILSVLTKKDKDFFSRALYCNAVWWSRLNHGADFSSGESRKFFLPVLCMPEAHNSGGSKIIFLWLLIKKGKWVLDIH